MREIHVEGARERETGGNDAYTACIKRVESSSVPLSLDALQNCGPVF